MPHIDAARRLARAHLSRLRPRRRGLRPRLERLETRLTPTVPAFSSLPGAAHTIFLDFDGHVTTGTAWNTYDFDGDGNITEHSTINSPAYDRDGDPTTFNATELADIEEIWNRVAEDYYPFQVNVTTVDPGVEALRKVGSGDSQWGIRVVFTRDTEGSRAGGIAWIDSFNWNSDTPAFVYLTGAKNAADAASHEAGHTLGLAHDGLTTGVEYYQGHGSGETGWAPIMGVGYYRQLLTWDRGEYYQSNNGGSSANYGKGPDDIAIITTYNGFGFRPDDHGDTFALSTPLSASGTSLSGSGFISTRNDVDVFSFSAGGGALSINVTPFSPGANLDVRADLYDAVGTLIATANPTDTLRASLNVTVAAGMYFLVVDGVGWGNPGANPPTGYSDYGSVGRYTITGSRVDPGSQPELSINDVTVSETDGVATFTVTLRGTPTGPVTVTYSTANGTALAGSDYQAVSGTLTFTAAGSQTISVPILDDALAEPAETFTVVLSSASGAVIADMYGIGTILSDDVDSVISVDPLDATKSEGTGSTPTPFTFRVTRTGPLSDSATVSYAVSGGSGKTWASADDFDRGRFPSGTVTIPAGSSWADITVLVAADSTKESNEKFRVTISSPPAGYTLGTSTADGTIVNDDAGRTGKGPSKAAEEPSHEELEAAGLIPCALPRPEDVEQWLRARWEASRHATVVQFVPATFLGAHRAEGTTFQGPLPEALAAHDAALTDLASLFKSPHTRRTRPAVLVS